MLLSIVVERQSITSQIKVIDRLKYKLSNQLRHFKEFNQLNIIIKNIKKHLSELTIVEKYDVKDIRNVQVESHLLLSNKLKSLLLRKGHQLKSMITDAVFLSFAVIALGCLSTLYTCIDKIEKKLTALQRITSQLKKKTLPQIKNSVSN